MLSSLIKSYYAQIISSQVQQVVQRERDQSVQYGVKAIHHITVIVALQLQRKGPRWARLDYTLAYESSLTTLGKTLLLNLVEPAFKMLYLLPDRKGVRKVLNYVGCFPPQQCEG